MPASADRNLLFGILALQLDFVTKDALVGAMHAWVLDKSKPLGDILRDQGHLSNERLQLLAALVAEHLKQHGNDPEKSLAAVSSLASSVREELQAIPDADVQHTLGQVGVAKSDPNATLQQPLPPAEAVRYRILRTHAKGGLGEVFVAEDTELGRSVALKEIQLQHADDPTSRTRFVLEAEITGGLEHPGIVPVYGLGTYADGRPFYAMRFIKGDNLKQAIRRFHGEPGASATGVVSRTPVADAPGSPRFDSLEFRQLLRRFIDVCNAIAYAHSRGVLHRDLKPGNIMLGKYGETLVVDWGLAKVQASRERERPEEAEATLQPRTRTDASSATVMGQAMGTPAYMSPEQAAGQLDKLGPASDIYSLGATLYEILTGRVPFPEVDMEAVCKGQFPPPRAENPKAPRALEAVCLKAMALKLSDRYATAQELAAELERWLADEPVTAWRESVGARARRWVRKHSRQVTAAGATLVVGAVALGLLALERDRARGAVAAERDVTEAERQKTATERDRAVAARQRTREALDSMVSEATEGALTRQKELTPEQRKFLENVVGYYQEFAAEPGEDREGRQRLAGANHRLGHIYYRLGRIEQGEAAWRKEVVLFAMLTADFPAVPGYRRDLARSRNNLGSLLDDLGKRAEAEAEFRAALAVQKKLAADFPAVPVYRSDFAAGQYNLGLLLDGLGKRAEAEVEYRASIALLEKLVADSPAVPDYRSDLARSRASLGGLLANMGKRKEAVPEYRAALAANEKLAADFPAVPQYRHEFARSRRDLGSLLKDLGKWAEAEAEFRAARTVYEKLAADFPAVPQYRSALAHSRLKLGSLLDDLGKRADAEAEFRAALAVCEKLTTDFPAVPRYRTELAFSRASLGGLLANLGKWAEAETEYRAAISLWEKLVVDFPAVPNYRRELAGRRINLGLLLYDLGKRAEAEIEYRAALAAYQKLVADFPAVPDYRSELALGHNNLGILLAKLGKRAEAEAEYRAALAVREKLASDFPGVPAHVVYLGGIYCNLGELARIQGNAMAALAWHTKAIEKLASVVAAERRHVTARLYLRNSHWSRAQDLTQLRRYADALPDWDNALDLNDGTVRDELRLGRADCLVRIGRAVDAVKEVNELTAATDVPADRMYDCSCILALAAAAPDAAASDRHAARAVELLRQAIAKGYRDIPHLRADADLASLRKREDYAALLWDLANMPATGKEP